MSEQQPEQRPLSRRQFFRQSVPAAVGAFLAACGWASSEDDPLTATVSQPPATAAPTKTAMTPTSGVTASPMATSGEVAAAPSPTLTLEPTPACGDEDETPPQTAGPFYTPNTPLRTSFLEDGGGDSLLMLTGRVVGTDCVPIAGAVLDFWHADANGQYDNSGYRFRGHQFTDDNGNFQLETIMPGLYPGRARHIHVMVQGPSTPLLITQLYFPGEPANATDGIFDERLLLEMQETARGQEATFDFVLAG